MRYKKSFLILLSLFFFIFFVGCISDEPVEIIDPFSENLFIFSENDDEYHVTSDFTVVTEIGGFSLNWESSNEKVLRIVGNKVYVTRTTKEEFVTLKATYVIDEQKKTSIFLIIVLPLNDNNDNDDEIDDGNNENDDNETIVFTGYYQSLNGLTGDELRNALRTLLSKMNLVSDSKTKEVLVKSDLDPTKTNQLLLIYDRKNIVNIWESGKTWNREHIWPESKLKNAHKWDLHNLRASTTSVNSDRGNLPFRDGSGKYGKVGNYGWYPGDEDKGDVARIVFYMNIRWDLDIVERDIGSLEMFIRWHLEDEVDEFERRRNQVIYEHQNNRNPFIDYPELVKILYGNVSSIKPNNLLKVQATKIDNLYLLNRRIV